MFRAVIQIIQACPPNFGAAAGDSVHGRELSLADSDRLAEQLVGEHVLVHADGGGGRETLMRWHSDDNNSWQDPSLFGQARLVDTTDGN